MQLLPWTLGSRANLSHGPQVLHGLVPVGAPNVPLSQHSLRGHPAVSQPLGGPHSFLPGDLPWAIPPPGWE